MRAKEKHTRCLLAAIIPRNSTLDLLQQQPTAKTNTLLLLRHSRMPCTHSIQVTHLVANDSTARRNHTHYSLSTSTSHKHFAIVPQATLPSTVSLSRKRDWQYDLHHNRLCASRSSHQCTTSCSQKRDSPGSPLTHIRPMTQT